MTSTDAREQKATVAPVAANALRGLSPLRSLGWSFGLFFAGLAVAPVQSDIEYSASAVVYFLVCAGAAFLGSAITLRKPARVRPAGSFAWDIAARRLTLLASIGILLAVVDRFLIRGVSIGADVFEARSVIEEAGSGPVAVAAAFLASFAAFGWIGIRLARSTGQRVHYAIECIAIANLVAYVALSVAVGSRSVLFVCTLVHVCAFLCLRRARGKTLGIPGIAGSVVFGLLVIAVLAFVFQQRLASMGLSAIDSIQLSAYAFTLKPTDSVLMFLGRNDLTESFGAAVYSLILYVFHGFYEFLLVFDNYQGPLTHGAQLFWLPMKVAGIVLPLPEPTDLEAFAGYRSGVFTTFAGPMYVDFGLAAPAFIFPVFYALAIPFRRLRNGDTRWFFAALQVVAIAAFAPIAGLLQSAAGMIPLVAALCMVPLVPVRSPHRGRRTNRPVSLPDGQIAGLRPQP